MRQAPRERRPPGLDSHGTFPDDAGRRDRQCQPAPWGGWRIRRQSCSGVPVLVVLVVLVLVLVVVRAPRCCCDPPVYFTTRRAPGGLGHLVEGCAPLGAGDFVMGAGPWWCSCTSKVHVLHLSDVRTSGSSGISYSASATGVCQTGHTTQGPKPRAQARRHGQTLKRDIFFFIKKTQCKPFFASAARGIEHECRMARSQP